MRRDRDVPSNISSASGEAKFAWQAQTRRSVLWYPFDQYSLYVLPHLFLRYTDPPFRPDPDNPAEKAKGLDSWFMKEIAAVRIVLLAPAFVMRITPAPAPPARSPYAYGKTYEVTVERPRILQGFALVLLVVSVVALLYLAIERDETKLMLQVLGFFGTFWAVRSVLLTGVTVFPVGLDYAILALYLLAAMVLAFRLIRARIRRHYPTS